MTQYNIPFINGQTDRKDKPDIGTISEVFYIKKTGWLDRMDIYNTTGLQYCNVRKYRSDTVFRNI